MIYGSLCRSFVQPISRRLLRFSVRLQTTQPQTEPWDSETFRNIPSALPQRPGMGRRPDTTASAPILASQVTGLVKFFDPLKGYGFITRSDNQESIYVHSTGIAAKNPAHVSRSLADGETVVFDVVQGGRSIQAVRVTGPNGAPVHGSPYADTPTSRRHLGTGQTALGGASAGGYGGYASYGGAGGVSNYGGAPYYGGYGNAPGNSGGFGNTAGGGVYGGQQGGGYGGPQ